VPAGEADDEDGQTLHICLHAWFVVVEAGDAERVRANVLAGTGTAGQARDPRLPVDAPVTDRKVRRDSEGACADGLAMPFAFELAEMAKEGLTECSTLDSETFRNTVMLLSRCAELRGDRFVAGEAFALVTRLQRFGRRQMNLKQLRQFFVGLGDARASAFQEAVGDGTLYFDAPVGLTPDRARVDGKIAYFDDGGNIASSASLVLNLIRQSQGFKIDTFEVGAKAPWDEPS
jgi:hypothetical protein